MHKGTEANKKAIHFGITDTQLTDVFNGEKDAEYFHLFTKQKGYQSTIVLGSERKVSTNIIQDTLQSAKESANGPGNYFISISGISCVKRSAFNLFKSKHTNKVVLLSDGEVFTRKNLIESLSIFDADDRVFFLISDCETKLKHLNSSLIFTPFDKQHVKTKAAVLSLGLNQRALKHLNISSAAVDFEYAVKSAKTLQDIVNNLNDLNASTMNYVNSDLGCYNTHKNSVLVL